MKVNPQDVKNMIVEESFTILPNGLTTVCQLTLVNGWTVTGQSSCVDPDEFDAEIGIEIARRNAEDEVWKFAGYELMQKLHKRRMGAKERLKLELQELRERQERLFNLLHTDAAVDIPEYAYSLLEQQETAQRNLIDILEERLKQWRD
ncbi:hypothetical protein [Pseudomonas phage vB_PaeP_4029]|uniref:Uncharacterized protein n=4 Tax=Litunavirus TaxID=1920762 RepID=A0A2K8HND9_9CAUD|nr:hypothetical protein BI066_gp59 [Pseudomonas phage PEV2]YP_010659000.1 hypothetical protein PP757_gp28 [Pseudomonas phage vB_PaeP_TUMS_P121]AIZ94814.1 hypothetical protein [Pseudomonas phage RWG]ASZ72113.1 hypothetical protein vBPaePPYO2_00064 [Pseudomonas phage vB_PaeP_PYO2]ASZ72271.1 hypothetical protein vBPaePDEV_00064 [Pseudomonas phage vB_PaeP_DEV]UNY40770.1 hypothetical protein [Pseudomonas phage CMS1]UYE96399.1 hypothetical protein [Pseudomonas phage vB_PaeP_4029]UYE96574.1 hypothe